MAAVFSRGEGHSVLKLSSGLKVALQARWLRARPAASQIHMLHVPKTGGTAVAEALRPVAWQYHILFEGHDVTLADIPRDHQVFVFLREPVERFVSAFNSRLRRGRPRYSSEWTTSEALSFSHFQTPNALAEALTSSDPELVERARSAMSGIRLVRDHFAKWFGSIENLHSRRRQFVLLGLQRCLDQDFEFLKSQLHLPSELRLPSDDVQSHRTPPLFDRSLSPLGHQNLSDWYADDIAFYEEFGKLRKEWFGLDGPVEKRD